KAYSLDRNHFSSAALFDLGQQRLLGVVAGDRAPLAVADAAIPGDDEGLGHAGDAEVDAGAAGPVNADTAVRIAERREEGPGGVRLVLPGDAEYRDAGVLGDLREERMFGAAGNAPGGKEVDQHDVAVEVVPCQTWHAVQNRGQSEIRRRLADEGGRYL